MKKGIILGLILMMVLSITIMFGIVEKDQGGFLPGSGIFNTEMTTQQNPVYSNAQNSTMSHIVFSKESLYESKNLKDNKNNIYSVKRLYSFR